MLLCALPPPSLDSEPKLRGLGYLPAAPRSRACSGPFGVEPTPNPGFLRDSSKPEDTIHPALRPLKLGQAPSLTSGVLKCDTGLMMCGGS